MSDQFYTREALNRNLELRSFQTGGYHGALDGIHMGSLPPALGARTLPPAGPFATNQDVGSHSEVSAPQPLVTPLIAAGAFVAAYFLFLPMVM